MPWRALARIVDLEEVLSGQAAVAEALARVREVRSAPSPESRGLREAFNVLARVLRTRRATIRDLHDLAWLDQTVIGPTTGPATVLETDADRGALEAFAALGGIAGKLVPRTRKWSEVVVPIMGVAESLKVESGRAGPLTVGLVPPREANDLLASLDQARAAPRLQALESQLRALGTALRDRSTPAVILIVAASEDSRL